MRRLITGAAVAAVVVLGVTQAASSAAPPTPPVSGSTVGMMVDATSGSTSAVIDCGKEQLVGPLGDGTLLLVNLPPGRYSCTVTIRPAP